MAEETVIGFIDSAYLDDGSCIRGGILITDEGTKPLAFHATDAIRPTGLQKTLYGDVLETHILTQLIGIPLLKAVQVKPLLCLVNNKLFLEMRPRVETPILWIARHGDSDAHLPAVYRSVEADAQQLITSSVGTFEPVLLVPHKDYDVDRSSFRDMLAEVFRYRDLVEPFERIRTALEEFHKHEKGG